MLRHRSIVKGLFAVIVLCTIETCHWRVTTGPKSRQKNILVVEGFSIAPRQHRPKQRFFHSGDPCPTKHSTATTRIILYGKDNGSDMGDATNTLISAIGAFFVITALVVGWSEYAIFQTGCGPPSLPDVLERICYQGVIVSSGVSLFLRIVFRQSLVRSLQEWLSLDKNAVMIIQWAERSSALAVVGAFVALGHQYTTGARMEGLSGIDETMCRAIQQVTVVYLPAIIR